MRPAFRSLDRAEIDALLGRHSVGRLAYVEGHGAQIEPIHYVFEDGWIFGRTQPGSKLTALAHRPWVAFEVDEVDGLFDWRSVVVRGGIHFYAPDDAPPQRAQYDRALAAIRRLVPAALTAEDPVPDRVVIFGLHADDASGRAATTRA
jgi:nitroimidazol reductase NimA-like FMN-containing flavoprotein (pyridoxamine 5'-phosphate oxidase superfamily)